MIGEESSPSNGVTKESLRRALLPGLVLIVALVALPLWQMEFFARVPGDIGDSRLNNYFLEHALQSLGGHWGTLWHPQFFYPFPYVLGFSDNLLGSLPVYALARVFTDQTDTAFGIWFVVGYMANYVSCFYVLRRFRFERVAAIFGALIFAFALPTSAHAGHVQLHYRFALPLAIFFLVDFLRSRRWWALVISAAWTVWQFYLSIYMGFFLLLLQVTVVVVAYVMGPRRLIPPDTPGFKESWAATATRTKFQILLSLAACGASMALLFYPYWKVQSMYGFQRDWGSIKPMLPRPQSFVLSDVSRLWRRPDAAIFAGLDYRHEHQMFIGAIPLALALLGGVKRVPRELLAPKVLMIGMLVIPLILTVSINDWSLWVLFHNIPLASAIRAVTRLDQALLFPLAFLAALGIQFLMSHGRRLISVVVGLIAILCVAEASFVDMPTSAKQEWRDRLSALEQIVDSDIGQDRILFVAQRGGPNFADELDAMWLALRAGLPTMNGYSGNIPNGFTLSFGADCRTIPDRVMWYLRFDHREDDIGMYRTIMSRLEPVGFTGCDPTWWESPPMGSSQDGS